MKAKAQARPTAAQTAGMALFLLTCLNLFNFIDRYVLPGVQPLIQKEFLVNDAQIGLLTSAFFFTYMIVAPLTGWLGDRFPRRPLIVAGALIWSAATLLTATVHSYETLLIRHALVGIGEATFSIFAPALLIAAAFWFFVKEPPRGASDELKPTFDRATLSGLVRNPAFWTATLGMAMWTFA